MIPNIFFIILTGLITAYLTFLTTKGKLTDNRSRKYWDRLTKRGKIVFALLFSLLVVLIAQEINNQIATDLNKTQLTLEQQNRDKLIKKGVDSTSKQLYNDISKAFANQGIKFDSLK